MDISLDTELAPQLGHAKCIVAPSPMALVRRHTKTNAEVMSAIVYFDRERVRIEGSAKGNIALETAMGDVHSILVDRMGDAEFLISIMPAAQLNAYAACAPEVPERQTVPDFHGAFSPIGEILSTCEAIRHDCDVEINVKAGQAFRAPDQPCMRLSVFERVPRMTGQGYSREWVRSLNQIDIDETTEACQAIKKWFAGAAQGTVCWTWRRNPAIGSVHQHA